jgi:hypothetical protein
MSHILYWTEPIGVKLDTSAHICCHLTKRTHCPLKDSHHKSWILYCLFLFIQIHYIFPLLNNLHFIIKELRSKLQTLICCCWCCCCMYENCRKIQHETDWFVLSLYMVLLFQKAVYGGQDLAIKVAITYPKYSDLKIN